MSGANTSGTERFCSRCGDSLIPLARPHVARPCAEAECGKTKHVVETAPDGGITLRKGDRFTIPAGWLQISLSPASRGKLARPGLKFLLRQLFYAGEPHSAADVDGLLKKYEDIADKILKDCPLLKGIDQETPEGGQEAFEILEKDKTSREWHAALLGIFSKIAADAIAASNTSEAAWAMYHAAQAHAMVITTEPTFEQTLWRGYLANQVVYEAASAAASTPAEAEAIKALEPLFGRLPEATLYAWVHSGEPIGPRLGVKSLSEPLLKTLGSWHLAEAERKRAEGIRAKEEARSAREMRIKWVSVVITAVAALCAGIWAVLEVLGVL